MLNQPSKLQENPLQDNNIVVYNQRWLVLVSFSLMALGVVIPFVQYSPIPIPAQIYYDTNEDKIIWLMDICYLDYIFLASLFIIPIQKYLDIMIIYVGSGLFLISQIIYITFKRNYIAAFIAQLLIGIAEIVQTSSPVIIANRWFPDDERTIATSIATLTGYLGGNFGFLFPALYITDPPKQYGENDNYIKTLDQEMETFHYIQFGIALISFLMCLIFVRSDPPTPPSLAAQQERINLKESVQRIFNKYTHILDILTISVFIGIAFSFITIISVILPYSQKEIGLIGLVFQVCGFTSGLILSIVIDNQINKKQEPRYDLYLKIILSISFLAMLILACLINQLNYVSCCVLAGFIGFGLNGYFPIAIQSLIEKMYPCQETVLVTLIFTFAQVFGFLSNFLVEIPIFSKNGLWILTSVLAPANLYLLFAYKTVFNRQNFEMVDIELSVPLVNQKSSEETAL